MSLGEQSPAVVVVVPGSFIEQGPRGIVKIDAGEAPWPRGLAKCLEEAAQGTIAGQGVPSVKEVDPGAAGLAEARVHGLEDASGGVEHRSGRATRQPRRGGRGVAAIDHDPLDLVPGSFAQRDVPLERLPRSFEPGRVIANHRDHGEQRCGAFGHVFAPSGVGNMVAVLRVVTCGTVGPVKMFLGLVTHAGSRFNRDGAATDQVTGLAQILTGRGHEVGVLISNRDDFDPDTYRLGLSTRIASAWSQANLEGRWKAYVQRVQCRSAKASTAGSLVARAGSGTRRTLSALGIAGSGADLSTEALKRLINIDLSHIRVWTAAHEFGADTVLVLEDDARLTHAGFATNVADVLEHLPTSELSLAVLSESISPTDLGVRRTLDHSNQLSDYPQLRMLESPLTNTVCANAYSGKLIADLIASITPKNLIPVHPIDWRLNQYLLTHTDITCLWSEPAPFVQMSMH